jgi:hypothetical protein
MENQNETTTVEGKVIDMPKDNGIGILNMDVSRIIMGLTEIGNLDIDDFKTNYQISKTITNLGVVEKAYNKSFQSLLKKHVKVGEDGNYLIENGSYVFNSKQDRDAYVDAFEKLQNERVSAKIWKLKESQLNKIKGLKGTTMAKCFELIEQDETQD